MDLGLRGRKALITGASAGIGAGIARSMAREGANLVLVARTLSKLEQVKADILKSALVDDGHAAAPDIEVVACDLTQSASIDALAARFTDVDIVVNNAGAIPTGDLFEIDEARWRAGWDTKVFPYINMCRRFYPVLKARGGGVIINIHGAGSLQKKFHYICGGMGNAALDFFTQTMGAHSPVDNIRVLGVTPGPVNTERYQTITATRLAQGIPSRQTPFNRIASTGELGDAIAFLASQRSAYTSGAILVIDGGMSITTSN